MAATVLTWSIVFLLGLSIVLLLDIFFQRERGARAERRARELRSELQPALVAYLNDDLDLDRMLKKVGNDREIIELLILYYLERLEGESRDKLVKLAQVLGLVDHSVKQLRSLDWTHRDLAAMKLGAYSVEDAVPVLAKRLQDGHVQVRYTAARSLGVIGSNEAFQALLDILDRPELMDGTRILEIVQSMRRGQTAEPLRVILFSEDYPLRSKLIAIDLVGDIRDYNSVGLLHEIMRSTNKEKVVRAIKAVGKIGHPQSIDDILERASSSEWEIRAQALKAIGSLEIEEGIPALRQGLSDPSYWVRRNAAESLTMFGERGKDILDEVLETSDTFAQDIARYQLERVAA
jgi:HEAT repeat protein